MSNSATFKASEVFSMVNLPWSTPSIGGTGNNAVVEYLTEYFGDEEYSSVSDLVRDLEMGHYAAGSFGMIYTYELEDFLAHNIAAIDEVLDYWMDCTDENITVQSVSDTLVMALDIAVNEIAHAIEHADLRVIVNAVDYLDPNPEVIITDEYNAYDVRNEIIIARVESEVAHSTSALSEEEYEALEETFNELVYIVD